jgi:hypothetical protein
MKNRRKKVKIKIETVNGEYMINLNDNAQIQEYIYSYVMILLAMNYTIEEISFGLSSIANEIKEK